MNKKDTTAARSAIASGTYSLTATAKGRAPHLARFLSAGVEGAPLLASGWSETTLASSLGSLMARMASEGRDAAALGAALAALGATNSSAMRQATKGVLFKADGMETPAPLDEVLTALHGAGPAISVEALF